MVDYISIYKTDEERKAIIAKEEGRGLRMKHDNHITRIEQVPEVVDEVENPSTGLMEPITVLRDVMVFDHGELIFTDERERMAPPDPARLRYAALATDAERVAFIAQRLNLA